jgi:hypothetical protein
MTNDTLITIEKRRIAALLGALELARYAMLQPGSRIVCPPHTNYGVAHTINQAIAEFRAKGKEFHS